MTLRSMTGYGQATDEAGLGVEIRTVNHRHLDIHCRLPKAWMALESEVKAVISGQLGRGRVELSVSFDQNGMGGGYRVDAEQAARYLEAVSALPPLSADDGVARRMDMATLLSLPGVVIQAGNALDAETGREPLLNTVAAACQAVLAMRRREGKALAEEMAGRLDAIEAAVARLNDRRAQAVAEVHDRLRSRVAELVADVQMDEARLAQEVALLADRTDISEEIARLTSHIAQFRENLEQTQPVGRTLDFLVVEMNREANTTAAKCQDAQMVADVVFIKGELEKVREQVQNVE